MVGNGENILVEFDYNNIAVIDPNKIIDENGKAKERLVKHEELVMYVNLECKVIPRTKLLLGASNSDNLRTISVSSMNFLNPGDKTFLDNAYTDELTGKDTLKGEGVNQQKIDKLSVPNKTNQFYYNQTTKTNKEPRATDNGMLGIKSITVKQGLDFEPVVNIKLEDIKGRALFESGNDSPYSAFFNLPYPLFYLTIKGYYGKAVRLPLMLQDFVSSYNTGTGNFEIDLTMYSYKYSVLAEVGMGSMLAVPHMYKSNIQVTPKGVFGLSPSVQPKVETKTEVTEYGTQKIKEIYSEYKSKGMIPDDFPELTVVQMQKRLDQFIQKVLDEFSKQNLDPITNLTVYQNKVRELQGEVFYYSDSSWFNKYLDTENYYVLNSGLLGDKYRVYALAPEFTANSETVISELKKTIDFYNAELDSNETCGKNGSYEINGKKTPCEITNKVSYDIIEYDEVIDEEDIDWQETYTQRGGQGIISSATTNELKLEFKLFSQNQGTSYQKIDGQLTPKTRYFIFEGKNRFIDVTNTMLKDKKTKETEIENALTEALADQIKSKNSVLGFVPTIRNVLAVIFANGEAYLRLLDEVHTKAWNQRNSQYRKGPIFSVKANPDALKEGDNSKIPIYPWPEFIKETPGEDGQEKYEMKYPGDSDVIDETKAFLFDYWPEVEFVEEYIRGYVDRGTEGTEFPSNNQVTDVRRLSLNAIEFPTSNEIYDVKEETKFLFEIYERLMLTAFYSKMSRTVGKRDELLKISRAAGEIEKTNILESLGSESPFLKEKLANYGLRASNFLNTLKQFSNEGVGESWQNYIRGIFNTRYIKTLTNDSDFKISKADSKTDILGVPIDTLSISPAVSTDKEEDVKNYISASTFSNRVDFTDTYPFTEVSWNRKNLAGDNPLPAQIVSGFNIPTSNPPGKVYYETTKNLFYNTTFKVIANFSSSTLNTSLTQPEPKPFSGYNYKKIKMVSTAPQNASKPELNLSEINDFYINRRNNYLAQLPTEGTLNYKSRPGLLTKNQTVSILNTPFFTNSIQQSVQKFRNFDQYPYVVPAYLFINSLPVATLREKYTLYSTSPNQTGQEPTDSIEYMNYIFMTLKKYGAIHKLPLPWILKIGSVWHRYKVWAETGTDILDESWTNFPYIENFDPITSASTTDYALTLQNGQNVDIILQKDSLVGTQTFTQISTGFYPKTYNDFNVFYKGFRLFTGYTNADIQNGITAGLNLVSPSSSNITTNFSGDPSNVDRAIQLNTWSAYVTDTDKNFCYILPSHGSNINQVKNECYRNDQKVIEVAGNLSVFDGSVRTFWNAPNYGYFDVSNILKPEPFEYMKRVLGGFKTQENFSLNGTQGKYTDISELFSVFEKKVLDDFEKTFLDFCRPKYNYVDFDPNAVDSKNIYGNFQWFFSKLMRVPTPSISLTPKQVVQELQTSQIKNFTDLINGFMNTDMLVRYGNPSNFDKNLFYSFSNQSIEDPQQFEKYTILTPNALPNSGGTPTLAASRITYDDAWKTLLTYVGFSDIDGIRYSDTGSTIFDFFVDFNIAFTSTNIEICSPIIKIYATQKYMNKSLNASEFLKLMDAYIESNILFINKSLDDLFPKLERELGNIKITKDRRIFEKFQGRQTKLELYQTFKATNDKWISGNDFKSKTLFEDVLLFDRASRNIGDKVIVDIYKLKELLDPKLLNPETNMMIIVNSILKQNNFQYMNIPAYVNFYNVQEATKNPFPRPDGSLELANTLFGTFMNVDYRNSSTKMVCFYAGKPSVQLDTQGLIQGWKNDSFELRRADNPLVENQANKRDWDKSNKVVGFNVDIGPQNQSIFTTFSISQKNSTPTAESLQILSEMSRQAGNRNVATQNLSLYNLYKLRSYDCNVTMMGNAMIQPMMYFNLRYVPMFAGPYLITEVSHTINPGTFTTSVNGIRQPIIGLPIELDFLQSLRTNLVQKIIQKRIEETGNQQSIGSKNSISTKNDIVKNSLGDNKPSNNSECSGITKYQTYTKITAQPTQNKITPQALKDKIVQIGNNIGIDSLPLNKLKYAIFAQMYIQGGSEVGFVGLENNFIGLDLNSDWGNNEQLFKKPNQYFCVNRNDKILPFVTFDSVDKNIELLFNKWKNRSALIVQPTAEIIAEFINVNFKSGFATPSDWNSVDATSKSKIITKVKESISLFDKLN